MKKRIMVIDDDKDILEILNILLEGEGFEPLIFNTGLPAQQILDINPDLVLLDVRIDRYEKTGVEICQEVKSLKEPTGFPILLLSSEDNLGALARQCGADGYVNKPFNIDGLLVKLKNFVL